MHLARRCRCCNKWSRWVPHTAENLAAVEESPAPKAPPLFAVPDRSSERTKIQDDEPARPAAICDHREQLDRLIHHLEGIGRELTVICRALMGGVR
jgi:hypothetical protein